MQNYIKTKTTSIFITKISLATYPRALPSSRSKKAKLIYEPSFAPDAVAAITFLYVTTDVTADP